MKIIVTSPDAAQKSVIRYKLRDGIEMFAVILDDGSESELISFDPGNDRNRNICFVDVIGPCVSGLAKMKFYLPDGRIIVGRQFVHSILALHMIGDEFDGRFNAAQDKQLLEEK